MNTLTVALAAALVSFVLVPLLLRALLGAWLGRAVGAHALARQSDTIQLIPATPGVWKDPGAQARLAAALEAAGFRDAGTFTIVEMPGVAVRLLAHPGESWLAATYEHPATGPWLDCTCYYQDGTAATFSTLTATGLDPRPGFVRVNAPGLDPAALLARARAERPSRALRPASVASAARDFERAYAEEIAWRKGRGVSAREVAAVAERMKRSA